MPEAPFCTFDEVPRQFAQVSIAGTRAGARGSPQDMLEAHGDMQPVGNGSRGKQYRAMQSPQTGIAIRQDSGGYSAPHACSDQGESEVVGRTAVAGEGEAVLAAPGVNNFPSDDLEIALGPPVTAAHVTAIQSDDYGGSDRAGLGRRRIRSRESRDRLAGR